MIEQNTFATSVVNSEVSGAQPVLKLERITSSTANYQVTSSTADGLIDPGVPETRGEGGAHPQPDDKSLEGELSYAGGENNCADVFARGGVGTSAAAHDKERDVTRNNGSEEAALYFRGQAIEQYLRISELTNLLGEAQSTLEESGRRDRPVVKRARAESGTAC